MLKELDYSLVKDYKNETKQRDSWHHTNLYY